MQAKDLPVMGGSNKVVRQRLCHILVYFGVLWIKNVAL